MFAQCQCPRCASQTLTRAKLSAAEALGCEGCGGAFIAADFGLRLLAMLDAEPATTGHAAVPCCVCRTGMKGLRAKNFPVTALACTAHGVWLDKEDLFLLPRAVAKAKGKSLDELAAQRSARSAKASSSDGGGAAVAAHAESKAAPSTATEHIAEAVLEVGVGEYVAEEALGEGVFDAFGWLDLFGD